MKNRIFGALLCALFCVVGSASAQTGGFTTDLAQWQSDVPGTSLALNLESLVKFDGTLLDGNVDAFDTVPDGQNLGWGTLSQGFVDPNGVEGVLTRTVGGLILARSLEGVPLVHTIDSTNGALNGFCIRYVNLAADIRVYEGATLVDSFTTVPGQFDSDDPETHICWENLGGVEVTRVEVERTAGQDVDGNPEFFTIDGEFRFEAAAADPATCFEQLADVKAEVAALLADAEACDAYWLDGALDCIEWMQDDIFWDPSGDRLTQYGGSMFIGAAYTVCYLEYVDDPAADVLIDELLAVLECIVDNEIAYAMENGGNSCYIENAEHFADLGEIIDEDFDNQVVATLAYRLAWLHAYYATQ
jgi:hypothetical protein